MQLVELSTQLWAGNIGYWNTERGDSITGVTGGEYLEDLQVQTLLRRESSQT